jgi:hypothetical protein
LKAQQQKNNNQNGKTTDWFSQMAKPPQKKLKNGLTQEQEIQIGLEMIPMFKAKEEEAQLKYDKLQAVKSQLD